MLYYFISFLVIGLVLAVRYNALTISGSIWAFICGLLAYIQFGWHIVLLLFVFFISGTVVSMWSYNLTKSKDIDKGKRSWQNVLGNGAVVILLALGVYFLEYKILLTYSCVASIAAANSDTMASEIGQRLGSKFVFFPTFRKANRGVDGAISIEGTIAAFFGAVLISGIFLFINQDVGFKGFLIITISGFSGNLVDSILGTYLESRGYLNKHLVNFFCTASASVFSGVLFILF
ncbi:DUF92 domain-containing protein [Marinigracilibium pacificum]|uniref:DUF92 domain-containing protein n=1 Tax=Marinigracilibium pacificum TaxID=2729599 RepID=A0A848J6D2_9BACT|nr:DUF92 domain-containing protein [Marinigracilibium pacificum]NMM48682.1 DUF92 domain-containing protein [Marinigracilibium pacificum]